MAHKLCLKEMYVVFLENLHKKLGSSVGPYALDNDTDK